MNELDLVARLSRLRQRRPRGLVAGIGDDSAIYRLAGSKDDLLLTTDLMIEDVHLLASYRAEDIGHKALARGLSDIAAMGGVPRLCLVSLAVAPWTGPDWIDRFYRGLLRLARKTGCALAGGDLAHGETLALDVVVIGSLPRGTALRRDTAKPGDGIYVSGRLGGAALGLHQQRGAARARHLRPQPRLALGVFLRERRLSSAAMDLSDGLSIDLHRLCLASGVAADLDGESIPRFPGASLQQALHGGDDYELLFTARGEVPTLHQGLPLTRIGRLRRGKPGDVRIDGARLPVLGYDHFSARAQPG